MKDDLRDGQSGDSEIVVTLRVRFSRAPMGIGGQLFCKV